VPARHPPMPPVPLGRTGTRYAQAMNKLGWHWWPSDIAIATTEYEGRAKCINLGHCTPGCAQGAKASTDATYWPMAIRAGVELRARARVREVTVNEHGMATGAIYYDADGKEHFQPAEMVIMACNGVGTPRLLLNSTSARFPNGLANSSGLVGKNLMLHPWPQVRGYVEEEMDGDRGPMTCLWSKQFYETDPNRDFVRGYTLQFARGTGVVNEAIQSSAVGTLPWGRDHHRVYRDLVYHRLQVGIACEDLPEEHNRVTLDPVLKDSHGIPAPKVDYTISENTARMMDHGIARATEILEAAGAKHLYTSRTLLNFPGHLLGTCRMGNDPERSVVNGWGRSHDVKNLFIVDGSIWVTSGGVNPTSTIQALALYIADQIKQRLAHLFD
jgi:choline dehydrogenase-like flavoprotein